MRGWLQSVSTVALLAFSFFSFRSSQLFCGWGVRLYRQEFLSGISGNNRSKTWPARVVLGSRSASLWRKEMKPWATKCAGAAEKRGTRHKTRKEARQQKKRRKAQIKTSNCPGLSLEKWIPDFIDYPWSTLGPRLPFSSFLCSLSLTEKAYRKRKGGWEKENEKANEQNQAPKASQ